MLEDAQFDPDELKSRARRDEAVTQPTVGDLLTAATMSARFSPEVPTVSNFFP